MRKKFAPLILIVGIAGLVARDQPTNLHPVTLRECVESAIQRNFDVRIARQEGLVAGFALKAAYGDQYDPTFNVGYGRQYTDQPANVDPKKAGLDSTYQQALEPLDFSLSGRLTPGLSVNVGMRSTFDDVVSPEVFPYPRLTNNYDAMAIISMRQSLLKNFWTDPGRTRIQIGKRDVKMSEEGVLWQMLTVVRGVEGAYYDLLYARGTVQVMQRAVDMGAEILAEDQRRVAAGLLAPLGEKLAESRLETTRAELAEAEGLVDVRRNDLRNLLADNLTSSPEELLEPTDALVMVPPALDMPGSFQKALTARPDLMQARLDVEKHGLLVRLNQNQRYPNLDVVGSYGGLAVDPSRSDSFNTLGNLEHPTYTVGFVLSFPLGNVSSRNRYKASVEERERAVLELKRVEQRVWVDVNDSIKSLGSIEKRVHSTRQARIYADAALQSEVERYRNGATSTFVVLEHQRNLVKAQVEEIRALVDYNKAVTQLGFSEGGLLEHHHVTVEFKKP